MKASVTMKTIFFIVLLILLVLLLVLIFAAGVEIIKDLASKYIG